MQAKITKASLYRAVTVAISRMDSADFSPVELASTDGAYTLQFRVRAGGYSNYILDAVLIDNADLMIRDIVAGSPSDSRREMVDLLRLVVCAAYEDDFNMNPFPVAAPENYADRETRAAVSPLFLLAVMQLCGRAASGNSAGLESVRTTAGDFSVFAAAESSNLPDSYRYTVAVLRGDDVVALAHDRVEGDIRAAGGALLGAIKKAKGGAQ